MIRENPLKYWDYIALPFRRVFSRNILIIGTASEGKSHLAMDLAKYFGTTYAHEWPRDYMEKYALADWNLTAADFLQFLSGQNKHIRECIESPANRGVCFVDSDAITTDMYVRHYAHSANCDLLSHEYYEFLEYVADEYAKQFKWNKIFLLPPHGVFVDDHARYMADADIAQRKTLYSYMMQKLKELDLWNNVQVLDGDYIDNFNAIKDYVLGLYK